MKSLKRRLPFITVCIVSGGLLGNVLITTSPTDQFTILPYKVYSIIPFFLLFFLFTGSFVATVTAKLLQGVLIATLMVSFLLLRFYGFTQPIYTILLILLFLVLEIGLKNDTPPKKERGTKLRNS